MPEKFTRPSNGDPPRRQRDDDGLAVIESMVRWIALWGGGALLLGLMGLTVMDVALRYVFNAPLYGARDVGKLMLLAMVALSVAYSARTGGQVVIEFFSRWMKPRLAPWVEGFARIVVLMMLVLLSWQLWLAGRGAALFGEASMALGVPFGPFYALLALGMLLYAIVLAIELIWILRGRSGDLELSSDEIRS